MAYVEMGTSGEAHQALTMLNGTLLKGQPLLVSRLLTAGGGRRTVRSLAVTRGHRVRGSVGLCR